MLWHPSLLNEIPGKLLSALHRDVCRLRSSPWKSPKDAKTWFYALPWGALVWYHGRILREMRHRGWKPSPEWFDPLYRGTSMPLASDLVEVDLSMKKWNDIFCNTCPFSREQFKTMLGKWESRHNG